jgi:hypothetical protein
VILTTAEQRSRPKIEQSVSPGYSAVCPTIEPQSVGRPLLARMKRIRSGTGRDPFYVRIRLNRTWDIEYDSLLLACSGNQKFGRRNLRTPVKIPVSRTRQRVQ